MLSSSLNTFTKSSLLGFIVRNGSDLSISIKKSCSPSCFYSHLMNFLSLSRRLSTISPQYISTTKLASSSNVRAPSPLLSQADTAERQIEDSSLVRLSTWLNISFRFYLSNSFRGWLQFLASRDYICQRITFIAMFSGQLAYLSDTGGLLLGVTARLGYLFRAWMVLEGRQLKKFLRNSKYSPQVIHPSSLVSISLNSCLSQPNGAKNSRQSSAPWKLITNSLQFIILYFPLEYLLSTWSLCTAISPQWSPKKKSVKLPKVIFPSLVLAILVRFLVTYFTSLSFYFRILRRIYSSSSSSTAELRLQSQEDSSFRVCWRILQAKPLAEYILGQEPALALLETSNNRALLKSSLGTRTEVFQVEEQGAFLVSDRSSSWDLILVPANLTWWVYGLTGVMFNLELTSRGRILLEVRGALFEVCMKVDEIFIGVLAQVFEQEAVEGIIGALPDTTDDTV